MAIENRHLGKELVENPELYRAILRIGKRHADAAVLSMRICGSLLLSGEDTDGSLRQLEEFVYDNPLLLSPFSRNDVVAETRNFLLIPSETDPENYRKLLDEAFDEEPQELEPIVNRLPGRGTDVLFGIEKKTFCFLNRAFGNPHIYSHITPLLRFFGDCRRHGTAARVYVNVRKGSIDIAAISGAEILIANTFGYNVPEDAAYYILAVRRALRLDNDTDEVMICGDTPEKRALLPKLREFIPKVIPMIFPADIFRTGKEALTAPFDQMILPLCE